MESGSYRNVYFCEDCNIGYYDWNDLDNHCYDNGHSHGIEGFGCHFCKMAFRTGGTYLNHIRENGKAHTPYKCNLVGCNGLYTQKELTEHEIEMHHWCRECNRHFESANNTRQVSSSCPNNQPLNTPDQIPKLTPNPQHLNSRTHRGTEIKSPFCPNSYATATGMTHHLESGSCRNAPSLNRDSIYQFVRSKDPSGLISKKLIGWEGTSNQTFSCTDRAWNGHCWECYLCHRGFTSRRGLDQHLNSPAHQQNLYHCPNRSCRQDFKTLAAIINHLESEKCGAMRFEAVQRNIHGMVNGSRLLGYK